MVGTLVGGLPHVCRLDSQQAVPYLYPLELDLRFGCILPAQLGNALDRFSRYPRRVPADPNRGTQIRHDSPLTETQICESFYLWVSHGYTCLDP